MRCGTLSKVVCLLLALVLPCSVFGEVILDMTLEEYQDNLYTIGTTLLDLKEKSDRLETELEVSQSRLMETERLLEISQQDLRTASRELNGLKDELRQKWEPIQRIDVSMAVLAGITSFLLIGTTIGLITLGASYSDLQKENKMLRK